MTDQWDSKIFQDLTLKTTKAYLSLSCSWWKGCLRATHYTQFGLCFQSQVCPKFAQCRLRWGLNAIQNLDFLKETRTTLALSKVQHGLHLKSRISSCLPQRNVNRISHKGAATLATTLLAFWSSWAESSEIISLRSNQLHSLTFALSSCGSSLLKQSFVRLG